MAKSGRKNDAGSILGAHLEEQSALFRSFRSRSGDATDVEDFAQALWIMLSRNTDRAHGASRLSLRRIAKTPLIDHARAKDRRLSKAEMQVRLQGTQRKTPEDVVILL